MAEVRLTKTKVRAGIWEGLLTAEGGKPALEVLHLEQKLPGLTVTEVKGFGRQKGHTELYRGA